MRALLALGLTILSTASFAQEYKPPRNIIGNVNADKLISTTGFKFRTQLALVDHMRASGFAGGSKVIWFSERTPVVAHSIAIEFNRPAYPIMFTCSVQDSAVFRVTSETISGGAVDVPLVQSAGKPYLQFTLDNSKMSPVSVVYIDAPNPNLKWRLEDCVISKA